MATIGEPLRVSSRICFSILLSEMDLYAQALFDQTNGTCFLEASYQARFQVETGSFGRAFLLISANWNFPSHHDTEVSCDH